MGCFDGGRERARAAVAEEDFEERLMKQKKPKTFFIQTSQLSFSLSLLLHLLLILQHASAEQRIRWERRRLSLTPVAAAVVERGAAAAAAACCCAGGSGCAAVFSSPLSAAAAAPARRSPPAPSSSAPSSRLGPRPPDRQEEQDDRLDRYERKLKGRRNQFEGAGLAKAKKQVWRE